MQKKEQLSLAAYPKERTRYVKDFAIGGIKIQKELVLQIVHNISYTSAAKNTII